MPSSFLAKAIHRKSLTDLIDIHLAKKALKNNEERAKRLIDPVGFHPSQISACLRAVFYSWCGVPMNSNPPKPKLQRVFDNGDCFHERMQKYFRDMGILEGQWKCRGCGKEWKGLAGTCPLCNAPIWKQKFDEIDFHKGDMIGSCDGIILFEGRRIVIELKSMNSRDFAMLKKPLDHHREQGNCYMYALDVDECVFIYENKDTQDIKIFLERRDDKIVNSILKRMKLFMEKYWNTKTLPPRECTNSNWCAYQQECFIGKANASFLLAHRTVAIKEKQNANKDALEKSIASGKELLSPSIVNALPKRASGNVDKKSLLTDSAKAKLRKHGGRFSK